MENIMGMNVTSISDAHITNCRLVAKALNSVKPWLSTEPMPQNGKYVDLKTWQKLRGIALKESETVVPWLSKEPMPNDGKHVDLETWQALRGVKPKKSGK